VLQIKQMFPLLLLSSLVLVLLLLILLLLLLLSNIAQSPTYTWFRRIRTDIAMFLYMTVPWDFFIPDLG
jgi:uncharacterized membrane protein YqjE